YFRVIIAMYFRDGATEAIQVAPFYKYVLLAATLLTLGLGIAPGLLQGLF
ncbi:MAG: NADH-quinone oxidoreductase subunit N, partial [Pedobacter sp.]